MPHCQGLDPMSATYYHLSPCQQFVTSQSFRYLTFKMEFLRLKPSKNPKSAVSNQIHGKDYFIVTTLPPPTCSQVADHIPFVPNGCHRGRTPFTLCSLESPFSQGNLKSAIVRQRLRANTKILSSFLLSGSSSSYLPCLPPMFTKCSSRVNLYWFGSFQRQLCLLSAAAEGNSTLRKERRGAGLAERTPGCHTQREKEFFHLESELFAEDLL